MVDLRTHMDEIIDFLGQMVSVTKRGQGLWVSPAVKRVPVFILETKI